MKDNYMKEMQHLKAQKRVKKIKGFYTHVLFTIFIVPFWIFINLELVPQYHWFWFAIIGWLIGIFIHWLCVFGFKKFGFGKNWEERKLKEMMNNDTSKL